MNLYRDTHAVLSAHPDLLRLVDEADVIDAEHQQRLTDLDEKFAREFTGTAERGYAGSTETMRWQQERGELRDRQRAWLSANVHDVIAAARERDAVIVDEVQQHLTGKGRPRGLLALVDEAEQLRGTWPTLCAAARVRLPPREFALTVNGLVDLVSSGRTLLPHDQPVTAA